MQKTKFLIIMFLFCLCFSFSCGDNKVWVEGFNSESAMTVKRGGAAGVAVGDYLYVFGGIDGKDFINTTERAKINDDGSLGKWESMTPLNIKRGFFYAIHHDGYIYVIGGGNGPNGKNLLNSVERTKIKSDGTLEPWVVEKETMVNPRRCSKAVKVRDHIYLVGGYNGNFIKYSERAEIKSDGTLSKWTLEENPTATGRYIHALVNVDDKIFAIGGHHETKGTGTDSVEWVSVEKDGKLGKWKGVDSKLLTIRYGHSAIYDDGNAFVFGGLQGHFYLNSTEVVSINDNGELGEWSFSTPLPSPIENSVAINYKGNLYIIGGSDSNGFVNTVVRARIKKDGKIGYFVSKDKARKMIKETKGSRFEGIIIINDHADEYFNEGNIVFAKKRYSDAEQFFRKSLAINPGFMDAYQNLSSVYMRLERFDDALAILDQAIKKDDKYANSYYNKACIYSLQGEKNLAVSSLMTAVNNGFDNLQAVESDADLNNIRGKVGYKSALKKLLLNQIK